MGRMAGVLLITTLYPRKRTCALQLWMSALGQKRTRSTLPHHVTRLTQHGRGGHWPGI